MALRPAHVDTGMNVTIVRGNVDHLHAAHRAGDRQGVLQDQLPVHDPVRPRLRGRRAAARRGGARGDARSSTATRTRSRSTSSTPSSAPSPGYEQYVAGDLQKLGRTMVFAADPRFPEQVNLYEWLGARREKRAVCAECPWTTVVRGLPGVRAGEARHARRAGAAGRGGGVSDERRSSSASSGSTTPTC